LGRDSIMDYVKGIFVFFTIVLGVYLVIYLIEFISNQGKKNTKDLFSTTSTNDFPVSDTTVTLVTEMYEEHLVPHWSKYKNLTIAVFLGAVIFFFGIQSDLQLFKQEKHPYVKEVTHENQPQETSEGQLYLSEQNYDEKNDLSSQNDLISYTSPLGKQVALADTTETINIIESTPLSETEFLCKTDTGLLVLLSQQNTRSEKTNDYYYTQFTLIDKPVREYALCNDGIAFTFEDKTLGLFWYSFEHKRIKLIESMSSIRSLIAKDNTVIYTFNNRFLAIVKIIDGKYDKLSLSLSSNQTIDMLHWFPNNEKISMEINESTLLVSYNGQIQLYDTTSFSLISIITGSNPEFLDEDKFAYINGSFIQEYSMIDKKSHILDEVFQPNKLLVQEKKLYIITTYDNNDTIILVNPKDYISKFSPTADFTIISDKVGDLYYLQLYDHQQDSLETIGSSVGYIDFNYSEGIFSYEVHVSDQFSEVSHSGRIAFEQDAQVDFYYPQE